MSATSASRGPGYDQPATGVETRNTSRRLSTETKAAFKTTEFVAYLVVLAGILVAGAVSKASHYGGQHDPFRADRVWLYATVLTVGYMVSRGLAKAGSRQPYDETNS
jgi:hypothetical protein